jgi:hypothetical protein
MKFAMSLVCAFAFSISAFASTEWHCTGDGTKYYDYAHPERNTTAAGKPYADSGNPQFKITVDDVGYVIEADGEPAERAGIAPATELAPRGGAALSRLNGAILYFVTDDAKDHGNLAQERPQKTPSFQNFECYPGPIQRR